MQNRDQERANYAFEKIEKLPESLGESYRSLVLNAPILIHQCGLLQALSFHLSKAVKETEHCLFLQHVLSYLLGGNAPLNIVSDYEHLEEALRGLLGKSSHEIIYLSQECQKLLYWLTRFSEKFKPE